MKDPKTHIPYRNSNLTQFLKQALESNSYIVMVFTLKLDKEHLNESISSSKFAMKCRNIKVKSVLVDRIGSKQSKKSEEQIALLNEYDNKTALYIQKPL